MSPDEDALLNGIAADPAADLPRLVYADWLEEHGQDLLAEFIRIQCEIAKLEVGPRTVIDRNVHLWRRQQELLDGHMGALLEGMTFTPRSSQMPGPRFYRGFMDEIDVASNVIKDLAQPILRLRPTPARLIVTTDDHHFFDHQTALTKEFAAIVTELRCHCKDNSERDDFVPLANYVVRDLDWTRLEILTLVNNAIYVGRLVVILHDHAPALTTLSIHNSAIINNEVIDLLNAGILQRLSHISLIENVIGDQAAIELADRLGNSPNLKELDLRRNGITADGQAALLRRLGSKVILF